MHFTNAIAAAILAYCAVAAPAGPTCDSSESVCRKYNANNGLNGAECTVAVAQCIGACQVSFDRCSTAPDANHATCVASLVGCTGKSVEESLKPQSAVARRVPKAPEPSCSDKDDACRTAPGANQAQCSAEKAECKDTCSKAADECRSAPNSNMAQCAAKYSRCLGYNPYAKRGEEPHSETGDALYQPAPHSETGDAVYFDSREEPHSETGDALYQPAPHSETGDAVYFPAESKKITSSLFQQPKANAAAKSCVLKDDACRTAPGANQSQCSAEKAACKATCHADANQCRTKPDANQSACSADYAKCLGENPYAKKRADKPQSSSGSAVHQGNCKDLDDSCRTAPDANMSFCSAQTASCKATCSTENSACRVVPGANMAVCSGEYAQCLGENPYAKRDAPSVLVRLRRAPGQLQGRRRQLPHRPRRQHVALLRPAGRLQGHLLRRQRCVPRRPRRQHERLLRRPYDNSSPEMDDTIKPGSIGPQEAISSSGLTIEDLQSWYLTYMSEDSNKLYKDALMALRTDELNRERIKLIIQQLAVSVNVVGELCAQCQHLMDNWPDYKPWHLKERPNVGRTFNTLELEAAAQSGCKLCTEMLRELEYGRVLDEYRKLEGRLQALGENCETSLFIHERLDERRCPQGGDLLLGFPGRGHAKPGSRVRRINYQVTDPKVNLGETRSLDMAKMWLHECLGSHTSCGSTRKHSAPTRLVWIGDDNVKLMQTKEMEINPPYATLSYCWGTEPFTMLTSGTFDAFLNAIPFSDLPATARDAIHVARELGFSYIWIDALCIIQGDETDWRREAGQMHSVYGGSRVTIAASYAENAYQGCFKEPDHYNHGLHVRITTSKGPRRQSFWGTEKHHTTNPDSTTLATRAWVFQERLLSPRSLYCSKGGLFWECRSMAVSEFAPLKPTRARGSTFVIPENTTWDWGEVIEQYSLARLTYTDDRLPALSGIATRQSEHSADQYLAGMWRNNLAQQLLWSNSGKPEERPARPAPTWSWASIVSDVRSANLRTTNGKRKNKWYIHVIDAWTKVVGPDPHGAVSRGVLTLGCASILRGLLGDTPMCIRVESIRPGVGPARVKGIRIPAQMDCVVEEAIQNLNPVYLLPVSAEVTIVRADFYIEGLILQRCEGPRGRFRRIGYFHSEMISGCSHFPGTGKSKLGLEQLAYHDDLAGSLNEELHQLVDHVGPNTAMEMCDGRIEDMDHRETPYKITIDADESLPLEPSHGILDEIYHVLIADLGVLGVRAAPDDVVHPIPRLGAERARAVGRQRLLHPGAMVPEVPRAAARDVARELPAVRGARRGARRPVLEGRGAADVVAAVVGVRGRLRGGGVAVFVEGGLPESRARDGLGGGVGQGLKGCEKGEEGGACQGNELHLVGSKLQ
ncbi:hypothetical protein PG993_011964 [Apiospora rasikravindrae]|uniref:Heterokaryon incompatibility domain-containing protein n=1 Tax=Apiospora rasikravindrae TaxID=990691 RepID=A0ABR1S182_9PEZI